MNSISVAGFLLLSALSAGCASMIPTSGSGDYGAADSVAAAITEDYRSTGVLYRATGENNAWDLEIRQTPAGNPYCVYKSGQESWQGALRKSEETDCGTAACEAYKGQLTYGSRTMKIKIQIKAETCGIPGAPATQHKIIIEAGGKYYSACCITRGY